MENKVIDLDNSTFKKVVGKLCLAMLLISAVMFVGGPASGYVSVGLLGFGQVFSTIGVFVLLDKTHDVSVVKKALANDSAYFVQFCKTKKELRNSTGMGIAAILIGLVCILPVIIYWIVGDEAFWDGILKNILIILASLFVVPGVFLLVTGIYHKKREFALSTYSVNAKVVDIYVQRVPTEDAFGRHYTEENYLPVVEYYYGGNHFKLTLEQSMPGVSVGSYLIMNVNPNDPMETDIEHRNMGSAEILGGVIFLVFVALAAVAIMSAVK